MAEELRYTVKADGADKAAKELDDLAKKAGKIEGTTVEAKVTADTSRADAAIKRVDTDLADLSSDDKVAVLKIEAKQFQREIDRARKDLADLDGEEAQARISVIDNARANLERIQSKIEEIDRKEVDVKVTADTSQAESKLGSLDDAVGGLGVNLGALGALGSGAAPLAVGGGLVLGAAALATEYANAATEVNTMATLLGSTPEDASKLIAAFKRVGVEANDVNDIVLQTAGVLAQQPDLARQLGVVLGSSPLENFRRIVAATEQIDDAQKRATLQSQLFGEEGVRQVARVTAQTGSLEEAVRQVDTSQIYSEEDIDRAKRFNAEAQKTNAELNERKREIGENLSRFFVETSDFLRKAVGGNEEDQMSLSEGLKSWFGIDDEDLKKMSEAWLQHSTAELGAERSAKRLEDQTRRTAEALDDKYARATRDAEEATRRFLEEQDRSPGVYGRVGRAVDEHMRRMDMLISKARELTAAAREANAAQAALANFGSAVGEQDALNAFEAARQEWMRQNHEAVFAGDLGLDPAAEAADAASALTSARDAAVAAVRASMALGKTPQQQAQRGAATLSTILEQNPWLRDSLGGLLTSLQMSSSAAAPGTSAPVDTPFSTAPKYQGSQVIIVPGGSDPYANLQTASAWAYRNGTSAVQ